MSASSQDASRQFYTIKAFAALTLLSIKTIRRRIEDGKLEIWQPGGPGTRILLLASNLPSHQLSHIPKPHPVRVPSSLGKVQRKPLPGRKLGWKRTK